MLSHHITSVTSILYPNSLSRDLTQINFNAPWDNALDSASVLDFKTTLQDTKFPERYTQYPPVDFMSSLSVV